jgi:uncharacterized protein (TIGR00251 family)
MPAIRLRLRVSPGANTTALVGQQGDAWKIRVAAPPADGKANEAALRLLAETLDLPRGAVRLVSGASAREKIVELEGISERDAGRRLAGQV